MADAKQGSDLLLLFHLLASRDRGPSGFTGRIAIGVRADAGESWWSAEFGAAASSGFVDRCPDGADMTLVLSEDEANRIMDQGTLPVGLGPDRLSGDRELFAKFLDRYVKKRSMYELRSTER